MASLNKLAIRGIRSFDDKQVAVIEFFTPVTVIVGHNGSGKTTIIECLKYATTGDQPPNTRGGAFIHDPKMANEREVKAQVKLRFHAANLQRMLVVRNLSVTVKKNGAMTMKTLESILGLADGNLDKGGKRGTISTKVAEMDAEIPRLLGVSKAVLDNVIFCHQEDSYWPFAEASILKKKFDDIFEATKYTKALDSIKALRKERTADLKAEKERLQSLLTEKSHADKLRDRISQCNSDIGSLQLQHEEAQKEYQSLALANQKFYESATKFREIYLKVDGLIATKKRYQEDLDSARENLQEIDASDEELAQRLKNFDDHILDQKRKRRSNESKQQDLEEDLQTARRSHVEFISEQGRLEATLKAQAQLVADRDEMVRDIATKHQLAGFDRPSLSRDQLIEFMDLLKGKQRKQNSETDLLVADNTAKNEEFTATLRRLHNDLERHKQRRENARERTTKLQADILNAETEIDAAQELSSKLSTLLSDKKDKMRRLDALKVEYKNENYDNRISEKMQKNRDLETKREDLNQELRKLSAQADTRAKVDLKRAELTSKTNQVQNTLDINTPKFSKVVGLTPTAETMERELDRVQIEKDREHAELDEKVALAKKDLQVAETLLSTLASQLKEKRERVKEMDRQLRHGLEGRPFKEEDIGACETEIEYNKANIGKAEVLGKCLADGKESKQCPLCCRDMDSQVLVAFEENIHRQIKSVSEVSLEEITREVSEWERELKNLQRLAVVANARQKVITEEIPDLEERMKKEEQRVPDLTRAVDAAVDKLNDLKREIKDISFLKQHAATVSSTLSQITALKRDISALENDLSSSGSKRTVDDVQGELDVVSDKLRVNERERQALLTEKERQMNALRKHEGDLHQMQLEESDLKGRLRDKDSLGRRVEEMKKEQAESGDILKELDAKIAEAQAPIQRVEQEYEQVKKESAEKLAQAQRLSQELNISVDKYENMSKRVDRAVKEKVNRQLAECTSKIGEYEAEIQKLNLQVEEVRIAVQCIDKEINEAGASMANLRENIRVRKLMKDISDAQTEIDSYDMEEAAKAKRNFNEKYQSEKERETRLQGLYSRLEGELKSKQVQLKDLQNDMKGFEGIHKNYRDQLVKVKLSDMANNDLEKYAKALDNAIMKYHSLKMEEVNDTMRHLWNKTYQGTDIDGIKISSDNEGSTTKRSYNYRVVMTKDQVEMDMRGRCSAGQKMLASIIIRLALADSFGQNCGILALDEPTNALDTENIDALAESLVEIINERKNQGNFQLIIITHDETFLRKLGQSDVMEYYWRVSRDSRQKSMIERHRFG